MLISKDDEEGNKFVELRVKSTAEISRKREKRGKNATNIDGTYSGIFFFRR